VAGELLVISSRGVFTLRPQEDRPHRAADDEIPAYEVVPDERFDIEGNDGPLLGVFGTEPSAVWMLRGDRVYRGARQADGTYAWSDIDALRFPKGEETPLFIDDDGVVWMGNGSEIIRYDPQQNAAESGAFPVHVRKMTTVQDQQVLFGGAQPSTASEQVRTPPVEVDYQRNDLRFDFAAAHYGNIAPLEYQVRLEGHESDWSEWQSSTNAVYTDLTEGEYTFHVRARAGARQAQESAALTFSVLPPWYRTGWAYAAYIAAILIMGLGYRRYRSVVEQNKRVEEQAEELERERIANERLQEANRRLKQANELKDNFLANTSHELRTPLTTILGFADVLKEEAPEQHKEFVDIIEKSGHRLLRTLNAMLDLAKLRSGVAEVDLSPLDVVSKSKEMMELFAHQARQKGIDFDLDAPDKPVYLALDDRYFEQILDNLISNAIKFTDEGRVWVEIEPSEDQVAIRVCDTGAGIDPAFMPHIFEDFKQESSGLNRDHEGNGLGLAITKRLVHLMGGTIDAKSTKGAGSTFTVAFTRTTEPSDASSGTQPVRVESAS
jgi:signal transduction histidine kinase